MSRSKFESSAAGGTTADWIRSGSYELESLGRRYPATAHLRAPFDPEGRRIRGEYDPEEVGAGPGRLKEAAERVQV